MTTLFFAFWLHSSNHANCSSSEGSQGEGLLKQPKFGVLVHTPCGKSDKQMVWATSASALRAVFLLRQGVLSKPNLVFLVAAGLFLTPLFLWTLSVSSKWLICEFSNPRHYVETLGVCDTSLSSSVLLFFFTLVAQNHSSRIVRNMGLEVGRTDWVSALVCTTNASLLNLWHP